jgi:Calcineurin-like phosphoesterase
MAVPSSANAEIVETSFQQGLNGYSGTVDTFLMEHEPASSHGALESLEWDTDDPFGTDELKFVLIRFNDIFGSSPGQIPSGATIESAILSYTVFNAGDPADVNEVVVDWVENVTYDGFGGETGVQSDEYAASVGQGTGSSEGVKTIDVTSSLASWTVDPSMNHGWIFRPTGIDGVDFRSKEFVTIGDRPKLVVSYNTEPPSTPPGPPTLNAPMDDAVSVFTSPTLDVGVFDSDTESLTVTFYGREVSNDGGEDFTIIALPDTQYYSEQIPDTYFIGQTQWIAAQKDNLNIVYVAHEGDIVQTASITDQWVHADSAMSLLEDPITTGLADGIPYGVVPGNHDEPTTNYNIYFGVSRFEGRSYYGGHYDSNNDNNYVLFSAGGMDFIVINLEFEPRTAVLDWADARLKEYSDRRGIVVSHYILNINDSWGYEAIYTALKDNPNLFLMLCGHMHTPTDGAAIRTETGDDGNTIYVLLADYQGYPNGGNGYLRMMQFSPANNKIYVKTYSPSLSGYLTDSANEFELDVDMSESFQEIGESLAVAPGSDAAMDWPGLKPITEYEWYVTVNDGYSSTTGPVWSFTTTAGLTGDFNGDCDVDGADLVAYIFDARGITPGEFAADFGKDDCSY